MPTLGSSVLVVGHPEARHLTFGPDHCATVSEAQKLVGKRSEYSVLVCPADEDNLNITNLINDARQKSPAVQVILVTNSESDETLSLINTFQVFKLLESYQDPSLELYVQEALERSSTLAQHSQYLSLLKEQNQKLQQLQEDLEERVAKRQRYLYQSRRRLLLTNERAEALQRALIAIQKSTSVGRMEILLNEALVPVLYLRWTRIFFAAQESIFQKESVGSSFSLFEAPLYRHQEKIGTIYFLRDAKKPFAKSETQFLLQVADAASLGLDRIIKTDEAESMKEQWEATFNAINEPLCILDRQGRVLQWNQSFIKSIAGPETSIFGAAPNDLLFPESAPQVPPGENKRIRFQKQTGENCVIDIYSQPINMTSTDTHYVNIYYDVTDQDKMEHQLLESAKMAELGTIGSSIAHELNNPLGGMISFIQLIKMDLPKGDPLTDDILEMEKGALRCKEIVQNLLGFTRMPSSDEKSEIDLRDVIRRSAAITELQTRSRGIKLTVHFPNQPCPFHGHLNMLSQAVKNLIQNAYESITEKRSKDRSLKGEIAVDLVRSDKDYCIRITDNGAGIEESISSKVTTPLFSTKDRHSNPGLGLSVASQIIREHDGLLEIESQVQKGTTARVLLPRRS